MAQQLPGGQVSIGRSASSSSLTGESSSAVIGSYGNSLGTSGRGLAAGTPYELMQKIFRLDSKTRLV